MVTLDVCRQAKTRSKHCKQVDPRVRSCIARKQIQRLQADAGLDLADAHLIGAYSLVEDA